MSSKTKQMTPEPVKGPTPPRQVPPPPTNLKVSNGGLPGDAKLNGGETHQIIHPRHVDSFLKTNTLHQAVVPSFLEKKSKAFAFNSIFFPEIIKAQKLT